MTQQRPARLQPGMTIGVIAPSSALRDERLAKGIALLEEKGFRIVAGDHLYDRHGYLAGTDAGRAADLTSMFARRDIDAVFCARGGYGVCRLLDYADWNVIAANPKVFVGYSDITTLHLALERRAGLVTFHGPMVVTHGGGLSESASDCFWRAVGRAEPLGVYDTGSAPIRMLAGGQAQGRLAGGCLALLGAAMGTPEQPDFAGRIVLIEDVGEALYRVDRLLAQMLRAGLLQQAAGFVLGTVTGWDREEKEIPPIPLDAVWRDYIRPLGKPAIAGFPCGHEPDPLTLPLGCMAELDADAGTLAVLEPAVI
jgi:muramoyltetrapeptide carboxypeptidase